MRIHTRLGASICFAVFSLITVVLLLPNSGVLHRIPLKSSLDQYAGHLWEWASGRGGGVDNLRLVVLGDDWVHVDEKDATAGRGGGWPSVFCGEVNCTSHLTLATSRPADVTPAMGALTSNEVYLSSFAEAERKKKAASLLPDLAAQVKLFIDSSSAESTELAPGSTLFILSFGFWDIYHLAGLEYQEAQKQTDSAVDAFLRQIVTLYTYHSTQALARTVSEHSTGSAAPFRLLVPKLLDPTLVPGWLSRAVPPAPSSVAEHQKQAVYLTRRWNARLENALGTWAGTKGDVSKKVFCYDLPQHVVDILIEHQLEDAGLSDAVGLGKGESPFESVAEPCVREGKVCADPEQYLFWDDFTLGSVADDEIGKAAAGLVKAQKILARK